VKKYLYQHVWFQLFVLGLLLFLVSEAIYVTTASLIFFLLLMYIGAFTVPATFVAYFYEYVRDRDISQPLLTTSFIVGGTIGLVAAGLLESESLSNLNASSFFLVAVIEECAKLIFPLLMFVGWKYKHEADGLLFGVAAGMGFAALETLGYAITFWAHSGGDIGGLQQLLIIRGATSPAGHAAWTGFVCAVIWHQRQKTGRLITPAVLGALLIAILLHFSWNLSNAINTETSAQFALYVISWSAVILVSLALLFWRFRQARRSARVINHSPN